MGHDPHLTNKLHRWGQNVRERSDKRKLRERRSKSTPSQYVRTPEQIASAAAAARRMTGDRDDAPQAVHAPAPVPQGPAWLTPEQQLDKRLEAAEARDTTKAWQLPLL